MHRRHRRVPLVAVAAEERGASISHVPLGVLRPIDRALMPINGKRLQICLKFAGRYASISPRSQAECWGKDTGILLAVPWFGWNSSGNIANRSRGRERLPAQWLERRKVNA